MAQRAVFEGLIVDEMDRQVLVTYVGEEPCYVVDDDGFHRHIPSEQVDRQVLKFMKDQVQGHEDIIADQAAKMMGQDDLFTHAIIQNQIKQIDQQFDSLLQTGIPESGRTYMGMMGFKIVINLHGEVVRVDQPGVAPEDEDGE